MDVIVFIKHIVKHWCTKDFLKSKLPLQVLLAKNILQQIIFQNVDLNKNTF